MSAELERTWIAFRGFVPDLLIALVILIVGWLLALAIAAAVRWLLDKTTVDDRIAAWISDDPRDRPPVEKIISRIVFWLLMIFVLIVFFQRLRLPLVSSPLSDFVASVFAFLPNLLAAAALLALAWLVATGLRFLVRRVLDATDLDDRLDQQMNDEPEPSTPTALEEDGATAVPARRDRQPVSVSKAISETVYWLTFLLFLPLVLDALELSGLLGPVNTLLAEVLAFLPNLLAAGLILFAGWLVAKILRRVVTNLLAAAGLDRVGDQAGVNRMLGSSRLSGVAGLVVYVLVLVPVLIAALNALGIEAITAPASEMLDRFLTALPRLFAAALVLILAWVVAKLLAGLVSSLLASAGFDSFVERLGFVELREPTGETQVADPADSRLEGTASVPRKPSELAGYAVLVALMLFATIEALSLLDFEILAVMLTELTVFLGNVLLGLLILAIGLYLGQLAARAIRSSNVGDAELLAKVARGAVVVLAGFMALRQMGVAEDIINLAFGLLLGAVAVAVAIAFGIGGRDIAHRYLERWTGRLDERSSSVSPSRPDGSGGTSPPSSPPMA